MNVLVETITFLGDSLGVPVSAEVPAERPDSFVTVEHSGGTVDEVSEVASLTVQVWDADRMDLEELVESACNALLSMRYAVDGISRVDIPSKSYYPEQSAGTFPRYVLSATVYRF